jgi:ribosome biogenesis GTPase
MPMSERESDRSATVVAAHGQRGELESDDGIRHRYIVRGRRMRIVCGDRVTWEAQANSESVIVTTLTPRVNQLSRSAPGRGKPEVLAANLSLIAVVLAPEPHPDWYIVDRYLCAAEQMRSAAVLVANKCELDQAALGSLADYQGLGYPVLRVSAQTGKDLPALAEVLASHTGILVGQSGVGKSSLINALLPDAAVQTGRLSTGSAEGRHTTTASIMYRLPGGGRLIDTPGVREFMPWLGDAAAVAGGFREIEAAGRGCRFHNCLHLREPGCAVKAAVDTGAIPARRYDSYKRLLHSIEALS